MILLSYQAIARHSWFARLKSDDNFNIGIFNQTLLANIKDEFMHNLQSVTINKVSFSSHTPSHDTQLTHINLLNPPPPRAYNPDAVFSCIPAPRPHVSVRPRPCTPASPRVCVLSHPRPRASASACVCVRVRLRPHAPASPCACVPVRPHPRPRTPARPRICVPARLHPRVPASPRLRILVPPHRVPAPRRPVPHVSHPRCVSAPSRCVSRYLCIPHPSPRAGRR